MKDFRIVKLKVWRRGHHELGLRPLKKEMGVRERAHAMSRKNCKPYAAGKVKERCWGDAHENLKQTESWNQQGASPFGPLHSYNLPLAPSVGRVKQGKRKMTQSPGASITKLTTERWVLSWEPKLAYSHLFLHSPLLSYFPRAQSYLVSGEKSKPSSMLWEPSSTHTDQ